MAMREDSHEFSEDPPEDEQQARADGWYFDTPDGAWARQEEKNRQLRQMVISNLSDKKKPKAFGTEEKGFLGIGRRKDEPAGSAEGWRKNRGSASFDDIAGAPPTRWAEDDEGEAEPPKPAGPLPLRKRHSAPPPPPAPEGEQAPVNRWDAMFGGPGELSIVDAMREWNTGSKEGRPRRVLAGPTRSEQEDAAEESPEDDATGPEPATAAVDETAVADFVARIKNRSQRKNEPPAEEYQSAEPLTFEALAETAIPEPAVASQQPAMPAAGGAAPAGSGLENTSEIVSAMRAWAAAASQTANAGTSALAPQAPATRPAPTVPDVPAPAPSAFAPPEEHVTTGGGDDIVSAMRSWVRGGSAPAVPVEDAAFVPPPAMSDEPHLPLVESTGIEDMARHGSDEAPAARAPRGQAWPAPGEDDDAFDFEELAAFAPGSVGEDNADDAGFDRAGDTGEVTDDGNVVAGMRAWAQAKPKARSSSRLFGKLRKVSPEADAAARMNYDEDDDDTVEAPREWLQNQFASLHEDISQLKRDDQSVPFVPPPGIRSWSPYTLSTGTDADSFEPPAPPVIENRGLAVPEDSPWQLAEDAPMPKAVAPSFGSVPEPVVAKAPPPPLAPAVSDSNPDDPVTLWESLDADLAAVDQLEAEQRGSATTKGKEAKKQGGLLGKLFGRKKEKRQDEPEMLASSDWLIAEDPGSLTAPKSSVFGSAPTASAGWLAMGDDVPPEPFAGDLVAVEAPEGSVEALLPVLPAAAPVAEPAALVPLFAEPADAGLVTASTRDDEWTWESLAEIAPETELHIATPVAGSDDDLADWDSLVHEASALGAVASPIEAEVTAPPSVLVADAGLDEWDALVEEASALGAVAAPIEAEAVSLEPADEPLAELDDRDFMTQDVPGSATTAADAAVDNAAPQPAFSTALRAWEPAAFTVTPVTDDFDEEPEPDFAVAPIALLAAPAVAIEDEPAPAATPAGEFDWASFATAPEPVAFEEMPDLASQEPEAISWWVEPSEVQPATEALVDVAGDEVETDFAFDAVPAFPVEGAYDSDIQPWDIDPAAEDDGWFVHPQALDEDETASLPDAYRHTDATADDPGDTFAASLAQVFEDEDAEIAVLDEDGARMVDEQPDDMQRRFPAAAWDDATDTLDAGADEPEWAPELPVALSPVAPTSDSDDEDDEDGWNPDLSFLQPQPDRPSPVAPVPPVPTPVAEAETVAHQVVPFPPVQRDDAPAAWLEEALQDDEDDAAPAPIVPFPGVATRLPAPEPNQDEDRWGAIVAASGYDDDTPLPPIEIVPAAVETAAAPAVAQDFAPAPLPEDEDRWGAIVDASAYGSGDSTPSSGQSALFRLGGQDLSFRRDQQPVAPIEDAYVREDELDWDQPVEIEGDDDTSVDPIDVTNRAPRPSEDGELGWRAWEPRIEPDAEIEFTQFVAPEDLEDFDDDDDFLGLEEGEDEHDIVLRAFEAHARQEVKTPVAAGPSVFDFKDQPEDDFEGLLGEDAAELVSEAGDEPVDSRAANAPVHGWAPHRDVNLDGDASPAWAGPAGQVTEARQNWRPAFVTGMEEDLTPPWASPVAEAEDDDSDRRRRARSVVRELVETGLLALLVFLSVRASFQNFKVDGSSMYPTLENGQFLIVNKLVYSEVDLEKLSNFVPFVDPGDDPKRNVFHGPQRGDIVVLKSPKNPDTDLIKRVIGLPGETVEISGGRVYINGFLLEEPYITTEWHDTRPAVTIPPGEYFVMGDNRDNSADSRSPGVGLIPEELIIGKATLSYWPMSQFGLAPNNGGSVTAEEKPRLTSQRLGD